MVKKINIVEEGILYRNPLPQLRPIHAIHPVTQQLSEKEIFCIYRRGTAIESREGWIGKLRSTDGGKIWQEEGLVYDGSADDRPFCYRSGLLTKLSKGSLLLYGHRYDRSDPEKPIVNLETDGILRPELVLFWSSDGGHTWSEPRAIPLPEGLVGCSTSPVIELPDHNLLLPFETWKLYDDPAPAKQKAMAFFSRDEGITWDDLTVVANGESEGIYYWDKRIIGLGGFRLFATFWTHNSRGNKDLPIHWATSDDGGKTWIKPLSTGIEGQISCPVNLGNGRLLLVYNRRYGKKPGVMIVLSKDEGRTWDIDNQVMVWDAYAQGGVSTRSKGSIFADMAAYSFGKPNAERLIDGDILVSFWCTQRCVTHIRWARIRVE